MKFEVDRKELEKKNKMVDEAITQLKKEFIGIDDQIDSIMENVRSWFLYYELQENPCVINLFGMTGCGKSSLIKRIAELLNVEKDLAYFNFCAINEMSSYEVETKIEEELPKDTPNRIFVYDEFQYAATLDGDGMEKDNKNGLKPFWELLDTGIIQKRVPYSDLRDVYRVISAIELINAQCRMEIVNGVWVNCEECLSLFNDVQKSRFNVLFNCKAKKENDIVIMPMKPHYSWCEETWYEDNFFIRLGFLRDAVNYIRSTKNINFDMSDMANNLMTMDIDEIYDWLTDLYETMQKGYILNFKQSLIFVVANLDEAYMSVFSDVNPDMSPDQFHNITKKITVVDIKKALQKRFRNEQIARLGNIHVVYPSFSSESFRKIIDLNLNSYAQKVYEKYDIKMDFTKSIKELIFNEAVYPTHGTRPIFSTIQEIIKTKTPLVIQAISDKELVEQANTLRYSYKGKKTLVEVLDKDGNVILSNSYNERVRLTQLRKPTQDDNHAVTSVHESGHFAVFSYLYGQVPDKIISKSTDNAIGGFVMRDFNKEEKRVMSRECFIKDIMVALAGHVAEKRYFGDDNVSGGAASDLANATVLASKMVRSLGMGSHPYVTTYLRTPDNGGNLINEDDQAYINTQIKHIIAKAQHDVEQILALPHIDNMVMKSAKYLFKHGQMPKKMMNKIFDETKAEGPMRGHEKGYYTAIVNNF